MKRPASIFPSPEKANIDGILAIEGDLQMNTLISAYANGVFPWPHEDYPLLWFHPPKRGVLFFKDLHIPSSLQKQLKKNNYQFSLNQAFDQVIENCSSQERPDQDGTWITQEMILAYKNLHKNAHAHSLEVWRDDQLVGGIYGVSIGPLFSAESMFYKESNCSKLCFIQLCQLLKFKGAQWIDLQMLTPITESFGGIYVEQKDFCQLVNAAWASKNILFP